tara:strand:+ start:323 stop:451 length:129 start_codon:yes stop_codon:yes gene_type:complete
MSESLDSNIRIYQVIKEFSNYDRDSEKIISILEDLKKDEKPQ